MVASMNSLSPGFEVAMPAVRMGTGSVGLSIEATQVLLGKISSSSTSFKSYFQLLPAEAWIGLDRGIVRLSILRDVQYVPKSGVIDGGGNIGGLESMAKGDVFQIESQGYPLMMGSASKQLVGVYSTRYYSTSATGISSLSDARYKTNVRPMEAAVGKVMEMNPVRFDYANIDSLGNKVADSTRSNRVGFIAQELIEVCPEAVGYDPYEDFYTVDYSVLIPFLVKAVQEQQAEIEALKAALKAKEE